jgi:hypothetical protein
VAAFTKKHSTEAVRTELLKCTAGKADYSVTYYLSVPYTLNGRALTHTKGGCSDEANSRYNTTSKLPPALRHLSNRQAREAIQPRMAPVIGIKKSLLGGCGVDAKRLILTVLEAIVKILPGGSRCFDDCKRHIDPSSGKFDSGEKYQVVATGGVQYCGKLYNKGG